MIPKPSMPLADTGRDSSRVGPVNACAVPRQEQDDQVQDPGAEQILLAVDIFFMSKPPARDMALLSSLPQGIGPPVLVLSNTRLCGLNALRPRFPARRRA